MADIIILANSRKSGDSCLAGIDTSTGRWVRPVSTREGGEVRIKGTNPDLLDVSRVKLSKENLDDDIQPENRLLLSNELETLDEVSVDDIQEYLATTGPIFFNHERRVSGLEMYRVKKEDRKSLMLVECFNLEPYADTSPRGYFQPKATFTFDGVTYDLVITDRIIGENVRNEVDVEPHCILTLSLGKKYWDYYHKFIAGVIELVDEDDEEEDDD
ncbi:MAG: dual OB domain-containing protein [Planctomycetota bacterium]|jgi:hypothetical protein